MLQEKRYTLNELKNIITEEADFSPKYGVSIPSGDNKDGDKFPKDRVKEISSKQPNKEDKENLDISNNGDLNRTLVDLRYVTEPNQRFKDRVEAQIKGYAGANEYATHKNDEYGNADFKGNEHFHKASIERAKKFNDERNKLANSGLKSREFEKKGLGTNKKTVADGAGEDKNTVRGDKNVDNNNKEVTNRAVNEKKIKLLNFKHTTFLNEADAIKRLPEEYKTNGNKIVMKDMEGTEYLLECIVDPNFGVKKINVISKINKKQINEEFNRMRQLYEYDSSDSYRPINTMERIDANKKVKDTLDVVRGLVK